MGGPNGAQLQLALGMAHYKGIRPAVQLLQYAAEYQRKAEPEQFRRYGAALAFLHYPVLLLNKKPHRRSALCGRCSPEISL